MDSLGYPEIRSSFMIHSGPQRFTPLRHPFRFVYNSAMAAYRSRRNRRIAGVCGGIAEGLGWDPTTVRIAYVVLSLCSTTFPGILVYVVLWIAMPEAVENEER